MLGSYQLAPLHQLQCSWCSWANLLSPRIWPAVFFSAASLERYTMFCRARLISLWRSTHCSACRPYHLLLSEKKPGLDAGDSPLQAWVLLKLWEASRWGHSPGRQEEAVAMNHPWNDLLWVNSWKWHGTVKCDWGYYPRAMESLPAPHAFPGVC